MALYENGVRRPGDVDLEEAYENCRSPECFAWIGLHQPTEEEFDSVRREFDLHELAVEDAIKAHQRPKLEVYDDSLFVAWAAIIAVPTAIAGIYGMNFEHMPELGWTFGYPLVLVVIAAACVLLYRKFKRAGWL
jgi:magnesium transporter